jgi:transmembrane sensor
MSNTDFELLLNKYLTGSITEEELQGLNAMLNEPDNKQRLEAIIDRELEEHAFEGAADNQMLALIQNTLQEKMRQGKTKSKIVPLYIKKIAVAAIFLVLSGIAAWWFLSSKNNRRQPAVVAKTNNTNNAITPGGNRAILKLADGTELVLDSAAKGTVALQGQAKIIKLADGQLSYTTSQQTPAEVLYNTVSTPRGGQYQLLLADGTKVWLNASSSLRFPAVFNGKERVVELTGEGYFEVAKEKGKKPFIVNIPGAGQVEVLGTHFNINAYADEAAVKTTLLEGKVKVASREWQVASATTNDNRQVMLQPGEQAVFGLHSPLAINLPIAIGTPDLEEVMAWKNGMFHFKSVGIETILRQAARWYDVEFEYKEPVKEKFSGQISRGVNLDKLLKILELTGKVNFEIHGRRVVVKS